MKQKVTTPPFAVLLAMAVLSLAMPAVSASGQNSVPPVVLDAADSPAFAQRLTRPMVRRDRMPYANDDNCLSSGGGLNIIHSFTQTEMGTNWRNSTLMMDHAANLYGTTSGGDDYRGLMYKLARQGQEWRHVWV